MKADTAARRSAGRWAAVSGLFLGLAGFLTRPPASFPLFTRPWMEAFAVQDMTSVLNGSRRLGADLAFIQLLLYYGTAENAREPGASHGEDHLGHAHSGEEESPRPDFPRLMDYGLRVGTLDPYFHYAHLFTAGALGFNLLRTGEALNLLETASRADPRFWRYRLYAGALAYRYEKNTDKAIPLLEEAVRDPDCPSMIKNILATLHKQQGHYQRAAQLWIDLAENSRDRDYANLALIRLNELKEHLRNRPR